MVHGCACAISACSPDMEHYVGMPIDKQPLFAAYWTGVVRVACGCCYGWLYRCRCGSDASITTLVAHGTRGASGCVCALLYSRRVGLS